MARNLVVAGLTTMAWDRSSSATAPLADAGVVVAAYARDAIHGAGVVITMLPTADVVDSVIFKGGVASAFAHGCVWAQMGTIGVEATLRMRDRLARIGKVVVRRRAGIGQQGTGAAGPAADLGAGPPVGGRGRAPSAARLALASASQQS